MYDLIKKSITRIVRLTDEELDPLLSDIKFISVKRREIFLRMGDIHRNILFINKGLLRYYHLIDGEEITGQFFFEGGWFCDYGSFLHQKPSLTYVQALEKTELGIVPKTSIYECYNRNPKFERFGRIMAEQAFLGLKKKTESFTQLSPEERYLNLIKNRPKVIQRVPQHYIASYLGIKPQSLSRIRKRLAEKQDISPQGPIS